MTRFEFTETQMARIADTITLNCATPTNQSISAYANVQLTDEHHDLLDFTIATSFDNIFNSIFYCILDNVRFQRMSFTAHLFDYADL